MRSNEDNTYQMLFLKGGLLTIIIVLFFIKICHLGFVIHDDIYTLAITRHHEIWKYAVEYAQQQRISHLVYQVLACLPMMAQKFWVYKLFSYGSILFCAAAFYQLLKTYADKKLAYLSLVIFFSMATISNSHNLFIAYVFCRQIVIGVLFLAISFFLKYMKIKDKKWLLISALLYTFSTILFEGMAPFILIFIMLLWMQTRSLKSTAFEMRYHCLFMGIYLMIYFVWRVFYPPQYGGVSFYFGDIMGSLKTIIKYTLGAFPLFPLYGAKRDLFLTKYEILQGISVDGLISSVMAAGLYAGVLPHIRWTRKARNILVLLLVSMFLPNIIIGFTRKYVEWYYGGTYAYITSFYCWFFMAAAGILVTSYLYHKLRFKRFILSLLTFMVFCGVLVANINNNLWKNHFDELMAKYRAFDSALASEEVLDQPDGTTIYIPDYIGIGGMMERTQYYSKLYTDKTFVFTNKPDELDYTQPALEFLYNSETREIELVKVDKNSNQAKLLRENLLLSMQTVRQGRITSVPYTLKQKDTLFGPYREFGAGTYRLEIDCHISDNLSGQYKASITGEKGKKKFYEIYLDDGRNQGSFILEQPVADLEVTITNDRQADLILHSIKLEE